MSEPEIGGREPITVDVVDGGIYWWSAAGVHRASRSMTARTGDWFEPLEWTAKRLGARKFCICKRTKTPPFCANSHL